MFNFTGIIILPLKSRDTVNNNLRYTGSELLPQSHMSDLVHGVLEKTGKEAVVPKSK
jgi:hypothetical protein